MVFEELMPDPFFSRNEKLEPRFGPTLQTLGGAQNVPPAMDASEGSCRFEATRNQPRWVWGCPVFRESHKDRMNMA